MNERKLIDEIKLSLQQEVIAGYWNGKVFVSDDKKTYTNIISNSQPIGVGFIVPYEGRWLLVVGNSNSEGRKNIINSKRSRRKPLIEELVYPVITLFNIDQTFENSFEKETRWVYLGGNKPSNRLAVRNGEDVEFINIPFEIEGEVTTAIRGFISSKDIYFKYNVGMLITFLSIINKQKIMTTIELTGGTDVGMCEIYKGDGLWESSQFISRNQMHPVTVNGEFLTFSRSEQNGSVYATWNGNFSWERTSPSPLFPNQFPPSYTDTVIASLPVLNFKEDYFLQDLSFVIEAEGGIPLNNKIYTEETNNITLVNKKTGASRAINSDDYIRIASYFTDEITDTSGVITALSRYLPNLQPEYMIGMPILFYYDDHLHYGFIENAVIVTGFSSNGREFVDQGLRVTMSFTKKVKRPCSFIGLIGHNGSFFNYFYKNSPGFIRLRPDFIGFDNIEVFCGQYEKFTNINDSHLLHLDCTRIVHLDTLKGNKIYSVISPRKDLEGKILGELKDTVYIEVWKITEDGKILYSDLITANYNNLKESRFDFKNIYAHNYVL
jgi:hypothetical protein